METLNQEELETLMFFVNPINKNVVACEKKDPLDQSKHFVAFGPRVTVHESLVNLLAAAPLMYECLSYQYRALQDIINAIEKFPNNVMFNEIHSVFVTMQNSCLMAQRVAQVGTEEVAKSL
jgi:hypothetical protein